MSYILQNRLSWLFVSASYKRVFTLCWGYYKWSNRWDDSLDKVEILTEYCNMVGKIRFTLFINLCQNTLHYRTSLQFIPVMAHLSSVLKLLNLLFHSVICVSCLRKWSVMAYTCVMWHHFMSRPIKS